jgi:hypothetical protein
MFGIFKLLLDEGAQYNIPVNGQTVEGMMSLNGDSIHPGAYMFHHVKRIKLGNQRNFGWNDVLAAEQVKGSYWYQRALPYKEYILSSCVVCFLSWLMFGGSNPEQLPIDINVCLADV